jgi:mannosyltransferase OCH1-like enzyme
VVNEKTATSAAITFLAELRQQQYFNQGIPKRIFQYWDSIKPPAEVINFTNSWLKHNPEYQHQLFNEQTARDFLRNTYHAEVLTAYINASHAAQKADILRLALLYEYGGIYADVDDVCLKPLALLIPKHTKLLLYQEEYGTVGNNFIAVCAKHPVLKQALTYAIEALLQGDKESIWLSTGPAMVSRALALYLAKQWSQTTPAELQIVIITREELMRVVGIHGQLPYKNSNDSWLIKEFNSGERFDLTKVIL